MDKLLEIVNTVNTYLSDYILIILLVGVGLFFTIKTRFVQVRCFKEGFKRVFGKFTLRGGKQEGGLSSFQALATAIAAQVGTGNIVGACGAILIGGPGAIFWMWVIAFLGMATIYAEAVLAQETKVTDSDGNVQGGPVYYMKKAFPNAFGKFLSVFFAIATIIALGFIGVMVQSNSIGGAVQTVADPNVTNTITLFGTEFSVVALIVGAVIALISIFIFIGGVNRLASVTEKMVPIMAVIYLVGSLVIVLARIQHLPEAIGMIFKYAFQPQAIIGGSLGAALKAAISQGAKRGLFSNEAGMGSTPHAHALAKVEKPHDQGVVAMTGLFIDTFVVLTMTALIVITTLYAGDGILSTVEGAKLATEGGLANTNMVQHAFEVAFHGDMGAKIGAIFIAVCLFFFAFSTILGWNLFGKVNVQYLFGKKAVVIYSVISVVFIFLGAIMKNDLVWALMDMFNQLMVLPNVIALVALAGIVAKAAKSNKRLK